MINLKFHTPTFFEREIADWGCSIPHKYAGTIFYTIFEPANIKYFEEKQTLHCTGSEVHEKKAFPTQRGAIIRPGKRYTGEKCLIIPADYTYTAEVEKPFKTIIETVKPQGRTNIIYVGKTEHGKTYKTITYLNHTKWANNIIIECDGQIKNRKVQKKGTISFQNHELGTKQLLLPTD